MSIPPKINQVDHSLRARILNQCTQKVCETELHTDPFPHFVVRGILPPDVYAELLANLPSPESYEAFAYEKHQTADGQSNRFRYQFSNASLDRLPDTPRRLWYTVRSVLGSKEFKQAVFRKLGQGLAIRFGNQETDASKHPGYALPELFRETEGYTIKPHPDTRKKLVTMQFSLADGEHQAALGTEFYRRSLDPRSWCRAPRGFDIVKRMSFTPNTVYAFSVLNTMRIKSWHGRTAIPGDYGVRHSLLNIWYQNPMHANADLIQDSEWFASQDNKMDQGRVARAA